FGRGIGQSRLRRWRAEKHSIRGEVHLLGGGNDNSAIGFGRLGGPLRRATGPLFFCRGVQNSVRCPRLQRSKPRRAVNHGPGMGWPRTASTAIVKVPGAGWGLKRKPPTETFSPRVTPAIASGVRFSKLVCAVVSACKLRMLM